MGVPFSSPSGSYDEDGGPLRYFTAKRSLCEEHLCAKSEEPELEGEAPGLVAGYHYRQQGSRVMPGTAVSSLYVEDDWKESEDFPIRQYERGRLVCPFKSGF